MMIQDKIGCTLKDCVCCMVDFVTFIKVVFWPALRNHGHLLQGVNG